MRNIVICCDGTNNQFGPQNSNVIRLIKSLDQDPTKQIIYYDPGVGTLPEPRWRNKIQKKLRKILELGFGYGLIKNVEEAYSYLMDIWEPEDRLFLFGFSRGAYTVRVLAGLLYMLGLLPRGNQNLLPYVLRLFKSIRDTTPENAKEQWKLCDDFRRTFSRSTGDNRHFHVHFLGVWDTVSSVGWAWKQNHSSIRQIIPVLKIFGMPSRLTNGGHFSDKTCSKKPKGKSSMNAGFLETTRILEVAMLKKREDCGVVPSCG